MGFSVPLALWFRTTLRPLFEASVLRDDMSEYLSIAYVRRLWSEQLQGTGRHETKLWNLLMLALWDRRYRRSELLDLAEFQSRAH
jgi:hypothetical protein